MNDSVINAKYIKDYKIEVFFEDGKRGIVDFKKYIENFKPYECLKDIEYFKKFFINKEIKALCWPGDIDIAPETLYHEATGEPYPDWMKDEELKTIQE